MNPGVLRHYVTVQWNTGTARNSIGEVTASWATFAKRWARVEPLSGREAETANQITPDVTHKITLRYLTGLKPDMRIVHGNTTYNLMGVVNPDAKKEIHVCTAREVV